MEWLESLLQFWVLITLIGLVALVIEMLEEKIEEQMIELGYSGEGEDTEKLPF